MPPSGENTMEITQKAITAFTGAEGKKPAELPEELPEPPALPVRPPVLCAGCPHRASFYAVKIAMRGKKTIYCGDIGCYTLGNAAPLDMCDTCLCMGAGIGIAQGVQHIEPDTKCFAFVGDSTFFASGITGTINAFYNQSDMTLVVLDNSTTAMTGHQPHPGTGKTVMGQIVEKVSIEKVLRAIGLTKVETVDPLDFALSVETVKRVSAEPGVKAIIFRSPCIAITKPKETSQVDPEKCIACGRCIRELGCPALIKDNKEPASNGKNESGDRCFSLHRLHPVRTDLPGAGDFGREETVMNKNIILCGVGGQGTILASRLIAAAAMKKDIPVKTAETIGMAQRGGSVFSHLRLGENAHSPLIGKGETDLIIGFEPAKPCASFLSSKRRCRCGKPASGHARERHDRNEFL